MSPVTERAWLYQPLPSARRFHRLRTRYAGFSGPVGSGKSVAFCYQALFQCAYNQGLRGLIGAPTYPMLRDATQRTMFEILELEQIGFDYAKQENKITLHESGSEIVFRSLGDPERLRGPNLAWFGVDELTYCDPDAWSRLEARLRDPRSLRLCGFAAWTPKGFDAVYEQWIEKPSSSYSCVLASPRENFHVANTGMYDQLAASYDERLYRQEVLGEYLAVNSGQAYYAFNRNENVRRLDYDPSLPLVWSLDFNYNPMCSVICQIQDYRDYRFDASTTRNLATINVLDELYLANTSTPQACREFHERCASYRRGGYPIQVEVYGDATGSARQRAADTVAASDWAAVRAFFALHPNDYRVAFKYQPSNPAQRDRVAAVNSKLCNSEGLRSLFIAPECKNLIRDLERVVWKEGSGNLDQDTDPKLTHLSDSLGYLIETRFGLTRTVGGPRGTSPTGR
jgi:hypothetical protein